MTLIGTRIQKYLNPLLVVCVSVAWTFFTRWPYLHYGYYQDDFGFLKDGALLQQNILETISPDGIGWFYRPISIEYMRLLNQFDAGPVARHGCSLLLFSLSAAAQALVVTRLTRRAFVGWICLAFIVNSQIAEEAIWWISSASTLLGALFAAISLHTWISWRRSNRSAWFVLSLIAMIFSMCAKEDYCLLPAVIWIIDTAFLQRASTNASKMPYFVLGVWWIVWLALDIRAYCHFSDIEKIARIHTMSLAPIGLSLGHLLTQSGVVSVYPSVGSGPGSVIDALAIPLLILLARLLIRTNFGTALLLCYCACVLPVPLMTGQHALSQRFEMVPLLWSATAWSYLIGELTAGETESNKQLGWAFLGGSSLFPILISRSELTLYSVLGIAICLGIGLYVRNDKSFARQWLACLCGFVIYALRIGLTSQYPFRLTVSSTIMVCISSALALLPSLAANMAALSSLTPFGAVLGMGGFKLLTQLKKRNPASQSTTASSSGTEPEQFRDAA